MHAVKSNHYHVACTRVYEITHKLNKGEGLDGESVSHPNLYATKSRELEKARRDGQGVKTDEDVEMVTAL
jgi:DNA primase large subunit